MRVKGDALIRRLIDADGYSKKVGRLGAVILRFCGLECVEIVNSPFMKVFNPVPQLLESVDVRPHRC